MKVTLFSINKWNNTIAKWRATEDIHYGMHASELRILEKRIAPHMRSFMVKMNEITKKHFELDEKEQVKYSGEGEDAKPVFKPFMSQELYEAERNKLFSTVVNLI